MKKNDLDKLILHYCTDTYILNANCRYCARVFWQIKVYSLLYALSSNPTVMNIAFLARSKVTVLK